MALGPDHPDAAHSLINLAALYDSQGRYAEAEPLYKRSLAISEKALVNFPFQGERLGCASAVLPGVAIPSRSPTRGPVNPADTRPSHRRRSAL